MLLESFLLCLKSAVPVVLLVYQIKKKKEETELPECVLEYH